MKVPTALFAVAFLFVVAVVMGACSSDGGSGNSTVTSGPSAQDTTPPILGDIRSGGTSANDDLLKKLALTEEDLPPGFQLNSEDTTDVSGSSLYIARYFNEQASADEGLSGGQPLTAEVDLYLFETADQALDFYTAMKSKTAEQWTASTEGGRHLPNDPDFERLDGAARLLQVPVAGDAFGVEISERILHRPSGEEKTFFDVTALVLVNRAIASFDYGTIGRPVNIDTLVPFAEKLQERLRLGLRADLGN
ncbi:MAG: hypothetical protein Q7T33_09375 [Dehalococcoidia bacterium]|nr:hypothetical protein [Dehalococcoidia bacterium]